MADAERLQGLTDGDLIAEMERLCRLADPRAGEVFRLRLGLDVGNPRIPEAVGEIFGLSAERVEQVVRIAMAQIEAAEPGSIQPTLREMTTRLLARYGTLAAELHLSEQ